MATISNGNKASDGFVILLGDEPDCNRDDQYCINLGQECLIADLPALKHKLLEAGRGEQAVTVDAGDLVEVDTACLQLLCAFFRHTGGKSMDVTWQAPNAYLLGVVQRLGLAHHLGL